VLQLHGWQCTREPYGSTTVPIPLRLQGERVGGRIRKLWQERPFRLRFYSATAISSRNRKWVRTWCLQSAAFFPRKLARSEPSACFPPRHGASHHS